MLVEHTLRRYPMTPGMKDECTLPFAITACPFAPDKHVPSSRTPKMSMSSIPRCSSCYAYINCFCGLDMIGWRCSLCGAYSEFVGDEPLRYGRTTSREALPEMNSQLYEVLCPVIDDDDDDGDRDSSSGPFPAPRKGQPVFVALIASSGCSDFVELVRTGLTAALQALPPTALFGIITLNDNVGLWDVKGSVPVCRSVAVLRDARIMCPLEEALPIRNLLAPISQCRSSITAALDSLKESPPGHIALGPALNAVMDYLSGLTTQNGPSVATVASAPAVEQEGTVKFGPARVAVFIAGPPNVGPGATVKGTGNTIPPQIGSPPPLRSVSSGTMRMDSALAYLTTGTPAPEDADPASKEYYEQIALIAAMLGICIDLYAVGPSFVGLDYLGPLCQKTGGACNYYPILEAAALPQDLYRRVQGPHALACLLRVRTCPELHVTQHYGRMFADADSEQLYHMVACDRNDSVVFSLDFTSTNGFMTDAGRKITHPVIQIAFQYSVLISVTPDGPSKDTASSQPPQYEMQRRMRICTVAPRVAKTHDVLFAHAQVEPVITLLMHKVLAMKESESSMEARKLLQQWFITLCTRYHHLIAKLPFGRVPQLGQVDVLMASSESNSAMAAMASQVYALLRSPLLAAAAPKSSDLTSYLTQLWQNLPSNELHRAVCPLFVSFKSADAEVPTRHLLSKATLQNDNCPILLLDAFHIILVLYRNFCPHDMPFPPPASSKLRVSVQTLRQDRRIAPQVKFLRESDPQAAILHEYLIDEPQAAILTGEATEASSMGFAQWTEYIQTAVQRQFGQNGV